MSGSSPEADARLLWGLLLGREPGPVEVARVAAPPPGAGDPLLAAFDAIVAGGEYRTRVEPGHPPGHYYSPIVDFEELRPRFRPDRDRPVESLAGLGLTRAGLEAAFERLAPHLGRHRFPLHQAAGERYFAANAAFPVGDAAVLAAMIALHRPRRIVEVGSGFSTACMLDAIEREGLGTRITCIEPYADRLRALLRPGDEARVTLIETPVQAVDPALVDDLGPGDMLFIDSSHVLKTGSDVHFELFELLPRLASGVLVHLHDVPYPFEYNDVFLFERRWSWNEAYAVRAYLMHSARFRVAHFGGWVGRAIPDRLAAAYGERLSPPGSSLWIETLGAAA